MQLWFRCLDGYHWERVLSHWSQQVSLAKAPHARQEWSRNFLLKTGTDFGVRSLARMNQYEKSAQCRQPPRLQEYVYFDLIA